MIESTMTFSEMTISGDDAGFPLKCGTYRMTETLTLQPDEGFHDAVLRAVSEGKCTFEPPSHEDSSK